MLAQKEKSKIIFLFTLFTVPVIIFTPKSALSFVGYFSCDSRWERAWEQCSEDRVRGRGPMGMSCYPLPGRYHPSCEPNDRYLKLHRGGESGYNEMQRNRERSNREQEEGRRSRISDVSFSVVSYQTNFNGTSVSIYADVTNKRVDETLSSLDLRCTVAANGRVVIHEGRARITTNLLPFSSETFPIEFIDYEASSMGAFGGRGGSEKWRQQINSPIEMQFASARCEVTDAIYPIRLR